MTAEVALKVGMAAGSYFRRGGHRARVIVGKDTRLSGYLLEQALTAGFIAVGCEVILVGPMPTPAIAMLTRSLRADLGVMISASHNPYQDNGIKLFGPDAFKLSDQVEAEIEALMDAPAEQLRVPAAELGRAQRLENARGRYIESVKATFPRGLSLADMKVVIDCANGAAYQVAPTVLWELGADVIAIANKPDGTNINRDCGSTCPELMCKTVVEQGADIGIALDGDADRVLISDESGKLVDGDQIMALIADGWHRAGRLTGGGIVATIMSNMGLERFLDARGLKLERTKVGDRYVAEHMARQRLQCWRRAVRPHDPERLCNHRRRPDCSLAGTGGGGAQRQAGIAGDRSVHAHAAGAAQCPLWRSRAPCRYAGGGGNPGP